MHRGRCPPLVESLRARRFTGLKRKLFLTFSRILCENAGGREGLGQRQRPHPFNSPLRQGEGTTTTATESGRMPDPRGIVWDARPSFALRAMADRPTGHCLGCPTHGALFGMPDPRGIVWDARATRLYPGSATHEIEKALSGCGSTSSPP